MNAPELIRKKRNGGKLTREEIDFIIRGYLSGSVAEYQMSAFLMAVYFRGMDYEETSFLTNIILHSGQSLDLSDVPGIKVDKHSTGGIGDKVSIILAPMVAACGVPVPMLSGRALGHTGGTLDKLESIPGFRVGLTTGEFKMILSAIGVAMIGQTSEIAPADKRLYALRDVTATVECIPLIASSIMSKKLAEGIDALVLDVKTGNGAMMQVEADAVKLAQTMIGIGKQFSKKVLAFITDMNQPLGYAVGNWLEIVECIDCLKGKDVPDLMEVTYALSGAMIMLGGKAATIQEGIDRCRETIADGRAWRKFLDMARIQGGDTRPLEDPASYPKSRFSVELHAPCNGWVKSIDALEVGLSANVLGVGRVKTDDVVDPKAGVMFLKKIGDPVKQGETLAVCYSDDETKLEAGSTRIANAFQFASEKAAPPPLIHSLLDENGIKQWK